MIFHLDDSIKQWKLQKLQDCTVFDNEVLNVFKDTDFALITKYGIYFKEENYFFKNFSPEIKGLFEPCLIIHSSSLPLDIIETENLLLSALYKSGLYQQLEKSKYDFDIYVPNKIDEINPEILITHVKMSNMEITYGGVDTANLLILDEKEIRNIKFNFIDYPLAPEEIIIDEVNIDSNIFIIENIPQIMKDILEYKKLYDEREELYNREIDMLENL